MSPNDLCSIVIFTKPEMINEPPKFHNLCHIMDVTYQSAQENAGYGFHGFLLLSFAILLLSLAILWIFLTIFRAIE